MILQRVLISFSALLLGYPLAANGQWFTPLSGSRPIGTANDAAEQTAPFNLPAGFTQQLLTSVREGETTVGQSIVRVPGLGTNASMFDMSAVSPDGRYVFLPHETQYGAGLSRYDTLTDSVQVMFAGDGMGAAGNWANDYGAFDPAFWTPWNSLIVAEEWSGLGRLIEVTNPLAPIGATTFVDRTGIPVVAHEGIQFDQGGSMYFVDEWNSGSIYKFTPQASGNLSAGQTFVLKINDYSGDPTKDWNDPLNTGAVRTGLGTWVPITDTSGVALPGISDPYLRGPNTTETSRGGRVAANEVMGTPYGRPEDIDVATLANGNQAIYFAATSEQAIYSVELSGNGPVVRLAASDAVTPKNLGFGGTAATLRSPDNIAVDPNGNIYVIEDQPNITTPGAPGGDVWMLRDTNDDGIAESLDLFASHGVAGAESTGMIWDPTDPNRFFISIQHPESMVTAGGIGDALWVVTVPEPSGICGIAIGIIVAGLCRRRR